MLVCQNEDALANLEIRPAPPSIVVVAKILEDRRPICSQMIGHGFHDPRNRRVPFFFCECKFLCQWRSVHHAPHIINLSYLARRNLKMRASSRLLSGSITYAALTAVEIDPKERSD
jgi:hypothetical protein